MSKWISVKDRLPTKDKLVLVINGDRIEIMTYLGHYKSSLYWVNSWGKPIDVTHWMPLPEPPK